MDNNFYLAGKSQVCEILILGDHTYVVMSVQEVFHMLTSHSSCMKLQGMFFASSTWDLPGRSWWLVPEVCWWLCCWQKLFTASHSQYVWGLQITLCYKILCVSSFSSRCGNLATMSVSPAFPVGLALCCQFNPLIALRKPADLQCIRFFFSW